MLKNLIALWESRPIWERVVSVTVAGIAGVVIPRALWRVERWRMGLAIWGSLGILAGINGMWGVGGLLIAFGLVGGLVVFHFVERADAAEHRRRRRLRRAVEGYLRAEYELRYEKIPGTFPADPYEDFLKRYFEGQSELKLFEEYDEEGFTAEDLDIMRRESLKRAAENAAKEAAEREARRDAETKKGKP
jgi:hypothetical protein